MYRIGIIDDEQETREILRQQISRFQDEEQAEFEVVEFRSADAFLAHAGEKCHILFLDIDLPGTTGMELAEKIRETDNDVIIIFCTNLQQFAISGYKVSALGFIVKPIQWYSFHMYLKRAVQVLREREARQQDQSSRRIQIKVGSLTRFLNVADILYVEVQLHYLLYYYRDPDTGKVEAIRTRGSMQDVADQLSRYGFARCNVSYLVNLSCITAISHMDVYLGEQVLRIGRTYKDTFLGEFSRFMAKRGL